MRDLTKSMWSFTCAVPLFGLKQMANLVSPQDPAKPTHEAEAAFDAVTRACEHQLGETLRDVWKTGDAVGRGAVDLMYGMVDLESFTPSSMLRMATDTVEKAADRLRRTTAPRVTVP